VLHWPHVFDRSANAEAPACHVRLRHAALLPGLIPAQQPRRRHCLGRLGAADRVGRQNGGADVHQALERARSPDTPQ